MMTYVRINDVSGNSFVGRFVGLLASGHEGDSPSALVRTANHGLYVLAFHPSRVSPISRAEFLSAEADERRKKTQKTT